MTRDSNNTNEACDSENDAWITKIKCGSDKGVLANDIEAACISHILNTF